jgi:hypothetical protein
MGRACGINRVEVRCTQGLVRETLGKETLGMPRHRWEDNFKMGLREIGRVAPNSFWTGWIWLKIHTSGGFLSARYELSGFIECGE